jgi:hypothetical protein
MADRGNLSLTSFAMPPGPGVFNGPLPSVGHAAFGGLALLLFAGEPVTPVVPKTTGQIWPRGEQ